MQTHYEAAARKTSKRTVRSTRKQVSWADYPFELLGALATAGTGTWVAMAGVDYRTAHSMRTRLRIMQQSIREGQGSMPPKLVELAKRVHWYVEDDTGAREFEGTAQQSEVA